MRDRLISLLSAAATLLLVIILLTPATPPQIPPSLPSSLDRGRQGLAGLKAWLDHNQIANQGLQAYYDRLLDDADLPARGNLLISSAPALVPAREQELYSLLNWLAQGNSILLLSAWSDEPPWTQLANRDTDEDILDRLGFAFEDDDAEDTEDATDATDATDANDTAPAADATAAPDQASPSDLLRQISKQLAAHEAQQILLTPVALLSSAVRQVSAREVPAAVGKVVLQGVDTQRSLLVVLRDARQQPALWLTRIGNGQLWASRFADLFGNITLGEQDNAALLAEIISHSLGEGGKVIFDDMHFGVSALYDPRAFFADSRLHRTLGFILAFWLLYVAGRSNRFAPLHAAARTPPQPDFARAVGGFFARTLSPQAAAAALFRHFFNDLREHYKLPRNGEPVWELLQHHPRIEDRTLNWLQRQYGGLSGNQRCNLPKLRNTLLTLRNRIIP